MASERMYPLFNKDGRSSRTVRSPCHRPLPQTPPSSPLLGGLSSRSRGSTASSWSTTSGGSGADSRAHVGDQGLQVGRLEGLGEETRPVGLNIDTSSLEDGGDLLGGDGNIVIGEDEGGVDAGELRVGHFKRFDAVSLEDLAQN